MNNKRVTPFTFSLYWFHMHSKVAGHTFVHSFNILLFFSSLKGKLLHTQTHTGLFFFLSYGCFWVACSVCHRSEAKVNQIEYSCPLCVSFHLSPGLLSFHSPLSLLPPGAANRLTWGLCMTLLYPHEHTHINPGLIWGHFKYICTLEAYINYELTVAVKTIQGHRLLSLISQVSPMNWLKVLTAVPKCDTGQMDTLTTHFLEQKKT